MFTKNFHQLQTEVQRHVAADQVAQGSYNTCFIGCLAEGKDSPEFIQREYGIPLAASRIAEAIFEGLPSDEAPAFFAAFSDAIESDGKDLSRVVWQFLAVELRLLSPVEPKVQAVIDPVIDGMDLLAQGKEWSEEDSSAAARAAAWAARAADWTAGSATGWAARVAADAGWAAWAARVAADAGWAAWAVAEAGWAAAWAVAEAGWAAGWAAASAAASAADSAAAEAARVAVRVATRRRQRDLLLKLIKQAPIIQQENN